MDVILEGMLDYTRNVSFQVEKVERIHGDEEQLSFKENSVNAFVSNLSLHWVNVRTRERIEIGFAGNILTDRTIASPRWIIHGKYVWFRYFKRTSNEYSVGGN
jgi:hypothetical protein